MSRVNKKAPVDTPDQEVVEQLLSLAKQKRHEEVRVDAACVGDGRR